LWQYNSLVTKIVTKAILRGGFFCIRAHSALFFTLYKQFYEKFR